MRKSRLSALEAPAGSVTPAMAPLIPLDRGAGVPLYRQIYGGVRRAIVERLLRPGQRLPSTRALAVELGVSRIPVLEAFEQLVAEGYCESRVGSGTFVAEALAGGGASGIAGERALAPRGPRVGAYGAASGAGAAAGAAGEPWLLGTGAFRMSHPAVDHFPVRLWAHLVAKHARHPRPHELLYGPPLGLPVLREAVAEYLRTSRAVHCEAGQIMITSGSQQAIGIAARVLLDPGSAVWVEEPGYGGAHEPLRRAGGRLVPVPVDGDGFDVAAGVALEPRARAAYLTPSHQYPLGATMTAARRLQALAWAQSSGAWIFEDDYDSEYRYGNQPIASLQGLDGDARVVYIGTFSKVLFPALRVGYMAIPADLVARFVAVRAAMDICPPSLVQATLAEFLRAGHFARHLRKMRALYAERRSVLVASLEEELGDRLILLGDQAGMHLVAAFKDDVDDRLLAETAARQGLWTMPLSSCYLGPPARRGLVLGYGGTGKQLIPASVSRLRAVLEALQNQRRRSSSLSP
jgi:GntR family transcriptional regulator / MocR family aminotransferase